MTMLMQVERIARKHHWCDTCDLRRIAPGQAYRYAKHVDVDGLEDHGVMEHKECRACAEKWHRPLTRADATSRANPNREEGSDA